MNAAFIAALVMLGTLEIDGLASDVHIVLRRYCEPIECRTDADCDRRPLHPSYPPCKCIPRRGDELHKRKVLEGLSTKRTKIN
uniref:Putative salivary secreted protein n=1 Tax=Ixodes ricinus TaxID=34613 RepID=A0A090XBV8_IXORI